MKKYIKYILAAALVSLNVQAQSYQELEIAWPFANTTDWAIGSAHRETKYCLEATCPLNALDFYKTASVNQWDKPQGSGEVHAVMSGIVYKYDECYAIQYSADRKYRVKYYHMGKIAKEITREGVFVEKGSFIGSYSNNKKKSLCRGGTTTSPHVHISFFKKNAMGAYSPLALNNIKIGHFEPSVRTEENYSASCTDFNMKSSLGNLVICPYNKVDQTIDTSVALYEQTVRRNN